MQPFSIRANITRQLKVSASNLHCGRVVIGMVANKFSIADPADAGRLDVVGFDTAAPSLIPRFCGQLGVWWPDRPVTRRSWLAMPVRASTPAKTTR